MPTFPPPVSCLKPLTAFIAGGLLLLPTPGFSQTSEQQLLDSLSQAREALQQLDDLASTCLAETEAGACSNFVQAIDGALFETYLNNCDVARIWREEFVTDESRAPATTPSRSNTLLNFLIDVEYLCGANALVRATDFVVSAYRITRTRRPDGSSVARSLQYQLDGSRQNALREQQSRSLSQEISSQRERSRQQTQRQFDQLELELIRQQNNAAFPR